MPTQIDHTLCDHPSTRDARAKCRQRGGGVKVQVREHRDWKRVILPKAAEIVREYNRKGTQVTVRQLVVLRKVELTRPESVDEGSSPW